MICSKCGAPNEEGAVYCGECGAVLQAGEQAAVEPAVPAEELPNRTLQAETPVVQGVEEEAEVAPPALEPPRTSHPIPDIPEAAVLPGPAVTVPKHNPETAFLIEFLAGILGFLGIGYMYAGRTSDGVVRLVVWLVYTVLAWVVVGLLSAIFVGLVCIPFQLVLQIGIPLWSASRLKKQLLAEG